MVCVRKSRLILYNIYICRFVCVLWCHCGDKNWAKAAWVHDVHVPPARLIQPLTVSVSSNNGQFGSYCWWFALLGRSANESREPPSWSFPSFPRIVKLSKPPIDHGLMSLNWDLHHKLPNPWSHFHPSETWPWTNITWARFLSLHLNSGSTEKSKYKLAYVVETSCTATKCIDGM